MSDLLGFAFDAAIVIGGLLLMGRVLLRGHEYRRRAGTMSRRAARAWKWHIVLDLCWGCAALCFGGYFLLRDVGVSGFEWLLIPGVFAGVGLVVALLMVANPEWGSQ